MLLSEPNTGNQKAVDFDQKKNYIFGHLKCNKPMLRLRDSRDLGVYHLYMNLSIKKSNKLCDCKNATEQNQAKTKKKYMLR